VSSELVQVDSALHMVEVESVVLKGATAATKVVAIALGTVEVDVASTGDAPTQHKHEECAKNMEVKKHAPQMAAFGSLGDLAFALLILRSRIFEHLAFAYRCQLYHYYSIYKLRFCTMSLIVLGLAFLS